MQRMQKFLKNTWCPQEHSTANPSLVSPTSGFVTPFQPITLSPLWKSWKGENSGTNQEGRLSKLAMISWESTAENPYHSHSSCHVYIQFMHPSFIEREGLLLIILMVHTTIKISEESSISSDSSTTSLASPLKCHGCCSDKQICSQIYSNNKVPSSQLVISFLNM